MTIDQTAHGVWPNWQALHSLVRMQLLACHQGIAAADIAGCLQQSPQALRAPCTLEPMRWDERQPSLVFHGRQAQPQNLEPRRDYAVRLR